jgi:hypothetical protein
MYEKLIFRYRSTSVRLTRSATGAKPPTRMANNTATDRLVELLAKIIVAAIISDGSRAEAIFVLYSRVSEFTGATWSQWL